MTTEGLDILMKRNRGWRWLVGYLTTRDAFGDLHWEICAGLVYFANVMGFGDLLERRKSKSEDLSHGKRQKWKFEKQRKEKGTEKEKKKRK
jgi:hypothetical protein